MTILANKTEQRSDNTETNSGNPKLRSEEMRGVLIVEKNAEARQVLRDKLREGLRRHKYYVANSLSEAFSVLEVAEIDCVLVSSLDRYHDCISVLKNFTSSKTLASLPVVAVSEEGDERFSQAEIDRTGITHIARSDCTSATLCSAVSQAIAHDRLMRVIEIQNKQIQILSTERSRYVKRTDELAHELLTPLAAIQEFVSLVFDGVAGPVNEEQSKHLAYARGGCEAIRATVEHLIVSRELERIMTPEN